MKKKKYFIYFLMLCILSILPLKASAKTIRLSKNQTYQLEKLNWKIKNKKIVSITSTGLLKAKKNGTTYITARKNNKNYKIKIIVKTPVTVSKSITIYKTDSRKISITGISKSTKVTYSTKNKKIATVNKKGKITAVKTGTTTIVTKIKGKKYKTKVTVVNNTEYQSIYLQKGRSVKLSFSSLYQKGSNQYKVSTSSYGSVSKGVYTSRNYGKNIVTCTNGKHVKTITIYNYCWEAHRGYHKYYPENSIESIVAARQAGANSVEIDLRITKDGEFVLMHDATLDRLTNKSGSISQKYLSDLVSTKILYKNGNYYKLATLKEALEKIDSLGMNVTIHLKTLPSNTLYTKKELLNRLRSIIEPYNKEIPSLCIVVSSTKPLDDWLAYTNSTIEVRLANGYFTREEEETYCKKSKYVVTSYEHGKMHYNGYYHTLDDPY